MSIRYRNELRFPMTFYHDQLVRITKNFTGIDDARLPIGLSGDTADSMFSHFPCFIEEGDIPGYRREASQCFYDLTCGLGDGFIHITANADWHICGVGGTEIIGGFVLIRVPQ